MTGRFRFEATTAADDVTAFARALGLVGADEPAEAVPLTYPARWLAQQMVRDWIAAAVGNGALPVHAGQDFEYRAPLRIGAAYDLEVTCSQDASDPSRLTIFAEASENGATICTARTTILRLARTDLP